MTPAEASEARETIVNNILENIDEELQSRPFLGEINGFYVRIQLFLSPPDIRPMVEAGPFRIMKARLQRRHNTGYYVSGREKDSVDVGLAGRKEAR
jgi:hypothetical protein